MACSGRRSAAQGSQRVCVCVASERLTGTNPNGEPVYDETKTIDGHIIKTSATPPLRKWLSTPALPEEFVKHLPAVEDEDDPQ